VWNGRTRTYDLRGKKFCVVMAGNPYTESGEKFQIPDMLANRADVYNLGDVLSGQEEAFALSYIENCITSNPVLAPLATREQADIYRFVELAQGKEVPTTEWSHDYASVEINEIVTVLQRLMRLRDGLLKVNLTYIASASMDDRFRTEPPFKLQGSYRNMNKLAEKVVPAMTDAELDTLFFDHYVGEAQTLTTGAEANLLKLAELQGRLNGRDAERWASIKTEFQRLRSLGGADDDPVTKVTGQLSLLGSRLEGIRQSVENAIDKAAVAQAEVVARHEALARARPSQDNAARGAGGDAVPAWVEPTLGRLTHLIEHWQGRPVQVSVTTSTEEGLFNLLEQQVALVEQALIPLARHVTEVAAAPPSERSGLNEKLDALLVAVQNLDLWIRGTSA
jgi:hypothetical protein